MGTMKGKRPHFLLYQSVLKVSELHKKIISYLNGQHRQLVSTVCAFDNV